MRIIVHDYSGHPFQVELSRALAARGDSVFHLFSASFQTPHGDLSQRSDDSGSLEIGSIELPETIPKYQLLKRFQLEREYGRRLVEKCRELEPDVVISANTPTLAQFRLAKFCRGSGVRFVSWIQDLNGVAAYRILKKKIPGIGHLVGKYLMRLDSLAARMSDQVIVITEDFVSQLQQMGVERSRIHVVHNWAPIDDLPVGPRENDWSVRLGLGRSVRFIYSGTLAMKQNPRLLLQLARQCDQWADAELIVISEGTGSEWLQQEASRSGVKSLRCLGFQPFEMMDQVFASADVLVAILERDAGVFCVPSKVLSYMCAQRSLLAAIPAENLAARIVAEENAGLVVDPDDAEAFIDAARKLFDDTRLRDQCGQAARDYAERNFHLDAICDRFCDILYAGSTTPVTT